jgi:hypothetical protein
VDTLDRCGKSDLSQPERKDHVVFAIRDFAQVERLLRSLENWTEESFVLEVAAEDRARIERLRRDVPALVYEETRGRSSALGTLLSSWHAHFGDIKAPSISDDASKELRAYGYVLAGRIALSLNGCGRFLEEMNEIGLAVSAECSDWPVMPVEFSVLADLFEKLESRVRDHQGTPFRSHDDRWLTREDYELPATLVHAQEISPNDAWLGTEDIWHLFRDVHRPTAAALAWWSLVVFGLEQIDDFVEDNPEWRHLDAWQRERDQIYERLDAEEFWLAVSKGFFRPADWIGREKDLAPVSRYVPDIRRLRLVRELKEIYESYIIGNWTAVNALARLVLEQVVKHQLRIDSETQSVQLEILLNEWCRRTRATDTERCDFHRHLRNTANRRLHRRGLRDFEFEEGPLQNQALTSIRTLQLFLERAERFEHDGKDAIEVPTRR